MHWILQEGFLSETGWTDLLANLERFGIPHSSHAVVPRIGELLPAPVLDHRNVICIGSYSMRHVAVRHAWTPGVFDLAAQDFEQQRSHWGEHLLNAGSVVCALQDARFTADRMFVRPAADSKHFSGRVFQADEFAAWQSSIGDPAAGHGTSLTPTTLIQLSLPVAIHAEYRFWVVAGQIVTRSLYKRGNQVLYSGNVDERLARYVQDRMGEWMPHESFVIDVCDTAEGTRIVEINTLNSSGFYAADVQRLVLALEAAYSTQ
jgi:hypothetical protein